MLSTVDGLTLPTVVTGNETNPDFKMAADSIVLGTDASYFEQSNPTTGTPVLVTQGIWRFKGDSVFMYESELDSLVAQGLETTASLTMHSRGLHNFPGHDWVFTRAQ